MSAEDYPPRNVELLIRDFKGKIISGIVTSIDPRQKTVRVSKVQILEIVGLKKGLDPIYGVKKKTGGFEVLSLESISHWELLQDYLKLKDNE